MIGVYVKELRTQKGLTIDELAEKSGLSSKTIQRLENQQTKGSAYTIKQLAKALEINIALLTAHNFSTEDNKRGNERELVKKLNLSALIILFVPLGNLLLPLYYFQKNKQYPLVKLLGGKIMSFHILWMLCTSLALIVAPFTLLLFEQPSITPFGSLIFTYLFFWVLNIIGTLRIALTLNQQETSMLKKWPNIL